jgi:hypothetical protein
VTKVEARGFVGQAGDFRLEVRVFHLAFQTGTDRLGGCLVGTAHLRFFDLTVYETRQQFAHAAADLG